MATAGLFEDLVEAAPAAPPPHLFADLVPLQPASSQPLRADPSRTRFFDDLVPPAPAAPREIGAPVEAGGTQHLAQPEPNEWLTNLRRTANAAAFETKLAPEEETAFQQWKAKAAPEDSGADYDLRGAFKAGAMPNLETGHWPDTFKKPNHPTFSDQSIYARARPAMAGRWEGDKFIPPSKTDGAETRGAADDPRYPSFPGFVFDPKLHVPRLEHEKDDAMATRVAKATTNVLGEFVSGMSSPAMVAAPLQMIVATAPDMVREQMRRIEEADKTPAYSPERMEAALSTAALIAGGAVGASHALRPQTRGRNSQVEISDQFPITEIRTEAPISRSNPEKITPETARFTPKEAEIVPAAEASSTRLTETKGKAADTAAATEERLRQEYMQELEAEARELQGQMGDEFLEALEKAGGLPAGSSPYRSAYAGELRNIEEAIRDPNRKERVSINKIFSANAADIDTLATRLRDQGFNVSGPDDIFAMTDQRIRTGREIFGTPESAEYYSPKRSEGELFDLESQARDYVREFQGSYGALPEIFGQATAGTKGPTGAGAVSDVGRRLAERDTQLRQNRETLAREIEARATEEEFTAEGVTSPTARQYGRELAYDYAEGVRSGKQMPEQARYPVYRGDFTHRPFQYIAAADHALRIVEESLTRSGFRPKEDIYFSPRRRGGVAPIPPPPVPPGQVLTMGELPVTMERTAPGMVSTPQILNSLKQVMVTAGSVGEIRSGRFRTRVAKGIFKPHSEVVRLEHINDVPTAVHEAGHALMKQFYGTVKSRGLKWAPSATRRELIGLGKELYGDRRPAAGYTAEGFSEFLRLYLTTDGAGKLTPATLRFFEEGVLVDHPQVAAKLKAARSMIDTYRMQGAIARANTQLVREPGWTRRTLKALREFFSFQKIAESGEPLRQLSIEAKERLGKPLPPSADPYKLFKMKRGSSGPILERMVDSNMVDVWGNPTGPSLKEAFAEVKSERRPFLLYVFARAAERRWVEGKNPGITLEDASYIRASLESPAFDRAATKLQGWYHGVLDYVAQADPTMAPLVAELKQRGFYAPLARMLDESAVRREAAMAQSNPLYRMRGSGLPVKDIFDQTLINAARLISRANRQLVTNAVVKLSQIEGMGRIIEEVPIEQVRKTFNVEQIRRDLENMGIETAKLPQDHLLTYYTAADQVKGSDPIVSVKSADGSTHWYYVDPKIYDVLNTIEPFSLRSIPHIGVALDIVLGAPKRVFTLGTTGLRASFSLVTNPLRDPQGWIFQTKAGINPAKMTAAYFQAMGEQLKAAAGGKEGPLSQAAFNLGPQMSQPLGRDIHYTKRASNALFHGRFLRVVKNPLDAARQLINLPESFPRLAEFKRVGEEIGWKPGEGMTPDQAVELAIAFKEATVDFSAAGEVSRIGNEMIPFLNPSIQGLRAAARAFRDHPLRTTLLGMGLAGLTIRLWWQNKDKEWYRNLPWRERYYYTNIDDGKNVWQIPRPFEWGNLFQVMPEAALDSWYRQEPEAAKQAIGHILKTQNPLDYPVLLAAAKEQWQNRLDFWDRPIVPKSEIDLLPGAQVGPYTSKFATWLGKAFPNQLSPRRIDAAMRAVGGGAVPDLLDTLGLGAHKKTRETELADMPVVGRLWRRGGFYNAQSQHLSDFWEIKTSVDARAKDVARQMEDPSRSQNVPIYDPATIMAPELEKVAKDIVLTLRLANQMRESESRQLLYRYAAEEAKAAVDLHHTQEANLAE